MKRTLCIIAGLAGAVWSMGTATAQPKDLNPEVASAVKGVKGEGNDLLAIFEIDNGGEKVTVNCELFYRRAPITVANFAGLATGNKAFTDPRTGEKTSRPFYNGLTFHRVIPDFMIQGGDPAGNGTGGPGYEIKDEFHSDLRHAGKGIMSMANRGPNTGGSQFFITDKATQWLDRRHAVFGQCNEVDVVHKIATAPTGAANRPRTPVKINSLTVKWGKYTGTRKITPQGK
ncbi:MAG: peptidylprolyl isomerase [Bradymonadia bacterium]